MLEDKHIRVNYSGDDDFSPPLTSPSTMPEASQPARANTLIAQEAVESLHSLPTELNKIAQSMEKASSSRKNIFFISCICALIITIGGYYLIQAQVQKSLAENALTQLKLAQETAQKNNDSLQKIERDFLEKKKLLDNTIATHTSTLNKQMETSYTMMKEAYEKREAQLRALIGPEAKKLETLTQQYHLLEKSNDVLTKELRSSTKQLEKLYAELAILKARKKKLETLPTALEALQAQNKKLSIECTQLATANKKLQSELHKRPSVDARTPSTTEEIVMLRKENTRLRKRISEIALQNRTLLQELQKLKKTNTTTPLIKTTPPSPTRRRRER